VARSPGIVTAVTAAVAERWRARRANRVSKWDRPPDPKDWRYFVGGAGKVLIALGLLMFGFVAYQLWGTGIETARAQNRLESDFEEVLAEQPDAATTLAPGTVPPTTTPPTTAPTTTVPSTTGPVTTSPDTTGPATTAPSTSAPSTEAPVQEIPPIERGDALAKLEIPKIGKEGGSALFVVPGVGVSDLKKGPGHYPDTPLPGQLGNAAIAGHRTTYGEPFRHIDELEPGDEIRVTMLTGDLFVYEVTGTEIVQPSDYHVVSDSDPTVATLTLTSCHPVFTARQRIVVHATLRPAESAPAGQPTYYELEPADDEGDPPESVDDPDGSTVSDDATVSEPLSESPDEPNTTVAGGLSSTPPDGPAVDDAFAEGWFHDEGAWPQIILWGLALVAIGYGSRRLSRHFRRDSVGIAAAIVPFVVCLYFFYENVNRLLPPGL
jgi:sortase A